MLRFTTNRTGRGAGMADSTGRGDGIPTVYGDIAAGLARHGYRYPLRRMRAWQVNGFQARLLGRRAVLLAGPLAARQFYDNTRFVRARAVPSPIRRTLFGKGTVHGLDGAAHHHRKAVFGAVMCSDRLADLADAARTGWRAAVARWESGGRVELFGEAVRVLGEAMSGWAGITVPPRHLEPRLSDMVTIVDNVGTVGGQIRACRARHRLTEWARAHIDAVRSDVLHPDSSTALYEMAHHRDRAGRRLPSRVAADELLNVLRPAVAVARLVTFAAHALHLHPQWRHRLAWGDDPLLTAFVWEVRRFYPFVPVVAARVRREFRWQGHRFRRGRTVLLDLYGTNHDPGFWQDPDRFDPARFRHAPPDRFGCVPHGGGRADTGHRCPGEDATTMLLKQAVAVLARLEYRVPTQDLTFSYRRFPPRIRSGFIMSEVSRVLTEPVAVPARP